MAQITLITGGSRSGKSSFALEYAEKISDKRLFIATCPRMDNELCERIDLHQQERRGRNWDCSEEQLMLVPLLENCNEYGVILIDCLTLWVNNLLYSHGDENLSADKLHAYCAHLLTACQKSSAQVVLVTNEIGLGIVPDNPLSRQYRDYVGWCNQSFGRNADSLYLVTCGVAQKIK